LSSSSSSESLGNERFGQLESQAEVVVAQATTTTTTTTTMTSTATNNTNTTTTTTSSSSSSSSRTSVKYVSEGEQAWIQLRRAWTTSRGTTTSVAGGAASNNRHGVQKSINGGVALDDFNMATRQLRERLPLADMVAILHDLWQEDGTTL
jgi:hypothetical protein